MYGLHPLQCASETTSELTRTCACPDYGEASGSCGFYDCTDYPTVRADMGIDMTPFVDASPEYTPGDGWVIMDAHPDI